MNTHTSGTVPLPVVYEYIHRVAPGIIYVARVRPPSHHTEDFILIFLHLKFCKIICNFF